MGLLTARWLLAQAGIAAAAASDPPGRLLALRERGHTSDSYAVWIDPYANFTEHVAVNSTGYPLPTSADSAVDVANSRLFFTHQKDGSQDWELVTLDTTHHGANVTSASPFPDCDYAVNVDWAESIEEVTFLAGGGQSGACVCGQPDCPSELRTLSLEGVVTTKFVFPPEYMCVFDYASSFISGTEYWVFLLRMNATVWTLFGVDLVTGKAVRPPTDVYRPSSSCADTACLQNPIGFSPSANKAGFAYGIDISRDAAGAYGFQVAELDLKNSSIRLVGEQIPAGENFDLGINFLVKPPTAIAAASAASTSMAMATTGSGGGASSSSYSEYYYTFLGGVTAGTLYKVDVVTGEVLSTETPWDLQHPVPPRRSPPTYAHWLPRSV